MESPQRLTVAEQLVASQEQLAASQLESARLSAAQNGADARGRRLRGHGFVAVEQFAFSHLKIAFSQIGGLEKTYIRGLADFWVKGFFSPQF